MTTKCCKCCVEKDILSFVKDSRKKSGFSSRCKDCHNATSKQSVANNKESRKESYNKYYQTHKTACTERTKQWSSANPEKAKEIRNRYVASNQHKIQEYRKINGVAQSKALRAKYPEKYKARNAVNNAVAKSKIPKASELDCKTCGLPAQEYHHYKGYEKQNWLEVIPVCKKCHVLHG